ncbi:hypothetical protein EII34_03675 [Arachnia propionica]|uniref:MinD-like ATPase involved in chromosome partitioning or flagellar assembly n=1 Tax=Arachnia propionica TaxID=1750 RepID=A0A3P1T9X5_9ACTN|nr:hypothetical protein [Arachnia propionica]MDO5082454.1 hypothetical protein [Arachnia propionica]RRD06232.1 hypothetical protein EII34_03675 [Arachnia propionica]
MSIILVTGGPGAPGVTTTALGLALTWPGAVLLADCDRDPSQSISAGHLQGVPLGNTGLSAVALAVRHAEVLGPKLLPLSLPLIPDPPPERRFLPGFNRPEAVRLFDHVWADLANGFRWLGDNQVTVVVDAGRVGADGLPPDLVDAADAVLFVSRSSLRSLAASRLYLPSLQADLERTPRQRPLLLALVGPGRPYVATEVAAEFQLPVVCLPWQPREAAVLSDGEPTPRGFHRSRLMQAFTDAAALISRETDVELPAVRR